MPKRIKLGGNWFYIAEDAQTPYQRIDESVHVPRQDVAGVPGAQNLNTDEWVWTTSDWSGGEGRVAFDPNDADFFGGPVNPPHFRVSSGIDTRQPGEIRLAPAVTANAVTGTTERCHRGTDGLGWISVINGTACDVYKYTPSTNAIALEASDITGAASVNNSTGFATGFSLEYIALQTSTFGVVYTFDDATAATAYTVSLSDGLCLGIAIGANRLYVLYEGALYEAPVDDTAGAPHTLVQVQDGSWKPAGVRGYQITGIGNGVRWLAPTDKGAADQIWEYTDGTGKPIAVLPDGFETHSIHHAMGVTWIGGIFREATSIGQDRPAVYYIDADGVLQFLVYLRYESPDTGNVILDSFGSHLYIANGDRVYRYDTSTGGVTMEMDTANGGGLEGFMTFGTSHVLSYGTGDIEKSNTTYPTAQQFLESSVWDFDVAHLDKTLLRFVVQTEPLPTNTGVDIDYQDNEDGTWTSAGAESTSGATHTFNISSSSSTVKFKNLTYRVGLRSTSGGTNTPVVRSTSAVVYVNDYIKRYRMTLDLKASTSQPGGNIPADELAQLIYTIRDNKNIVAFEDHYTSDVEGDAWDTDDVILENPILERRGDKMWMQIDLKAI